MDDDTYALYDEYDVKLRGGFPSEAAAWEWYATYAPYRCENEEGDEVARVATAYEADRIRAQHENLTVYRVPRNEYRVLLEVSL